MRGAVAAAAGVFAAATAHLLDVTGRLPFVHETVEVRTSMSPAQVVVWLAVAAGVSAVAARTRVLLVGAPGALLVSATPELIGRHDPGALAEPGAILGALVQVLLLLAVVATALILERRVSSLRPQRPARLCQVSRAWVLPALVQRPVDRTAAPRGPPVSLQLQT